MSQPKKWSLIESWVNILIGLAINIVAQELIFPLFGIHISHGQTWEIAGIFTVISLCRSYVLRRVFNRINAYLYESN